jgi:hypothetical protein
MEDARKLAAAHGYVQGQDAVMLTKLLPHDSNIGQVGGRIELNTIFTPKMLKIAEEALSAKGIKGFTRIGDGKTLVVIPEKSMTKDDLHGILKSVADEIGNKNPTATRAIVGDFKHQTEFIAKGQNNENYTRLLGGRSSVNKTRLDAVKAKYDSTKADFYAKNVKTNTPSQGSVSASAKSSEVNTQKQPYEMTRDEYEKANPIKEAVESYGKKYDPKQITTKQYPKSYKQLKLEGI